MPEVKMTERGQLLLLFGHGRSLPCRRQVPGMARCPRSSEILESPRAGCRLHTAFF
jgi:hypothetical protein